VHERLEVIRGLGYLAWQRPWLTVIYVMCIVVSSVLEAVGIGSFYPIIGLLEDQTRKRMYLARANELLHLNITSEHFVLVFFLGVGVVFIIRGLMLLLCICLKFKLAETLKVRLQDNIFSNFMSREYSFFVSHRIGDLIQRQMTHTENAGAAVLHSCQLIMNILVFICLYAMMWTISMKAGIMVIGAIIVFGLASFSFAKLKIYLLALQHAEIQKEVFSVATEVLAGIRQVKIFVAEKFFRDKFLNGVLKRARIVIKNNTIAQSAGPTVQTIVLLGILLALFFAFHNSENKEGLIPLYTVLTGAIYRMSVVLSAVYRDVMQLAHFLPSVNIVTELDRMVPEEKELSEIISFEHSIKFENVSFSYPSKNFKLSDINLEFEKGKFYGIVGPSGSGKSSLVDLIIKFYQPIEGRILIDGRDLAGLDSRSWLRKVGLVSQDTFVFNGSILDNISFAKISSEVERNKAIQAAKTADIHEFVLSLPNGYDTEVGERGLALSGGQRQRLAIARAIYLDPEVFIFDEATSSLDSNSERKIQVAIESLSKTCTVIAVAHRISLLSIGEYSFVIHNFNPYCCLFQ
jgi:ABC-type bacteriocin/lantibiotic exporter with double-glycine peptidase domain